MVSYDLTKTDTLKFIFCLKKAPQKMAHNVTVYMEVTPLPPGKGHAWEKLF